MAESGAPAEIARGVLRASARDGEPDRYLSALLAPPAARDGLLAIAAFKSEITRVPMQVREPMLGRIRLQWWRDALAGNGGPSRTGNPIADAMADAIVRHRLPRDRVMASIDAQETLLDRGFFVDDADLEKHLDATEGNAFRLGYGVLVERSPSAAVESAIDRAALAYGIARSLGRLPVAHAQGRPVIPRSRIVLAGLDEAELEGSPPSAAVSAIVDTIARGLELRARTALADARRSMGLIDLEAFPAFLPLAMVEPYFGAQNVMGMRRLEQIAEVSPLKRAWQLLKARWLGRV